MHKTLFYALHLKPTGPQTAAVYGFDLPSDISYVM